MAIFYSALTNGFYPDFMKDKYLNAGSWPTDAIEISDRWHEYLIGKQGSGKNVTANEYGQPVLADQSPPTREELISQAEETRATLMAQATGAIAPLQDAADLGLDTDEERQLLLEWKKYRVLLSRVDVETELDIIWPDKPE